MTAALFSSVHLLALAIGLPGIFLRMRALRALKTDPSAVDRVFSADNLWGIAALLWLGTGLMRAFGGLEKGSGFYLASTAFHVKMALMIFIFTLELWPMITFIQWRIRQKKQQPLDTRRAGLFATFSTLQFFATLAMPFFASMMARGLLM